MSPFGLLRSTPMRAAARIITEFGLDGIIDVWWQGQPDGGFLRVAAGHEDLPWGEG